jgi:hypothetical protein
MDDINRTKMAIEIELEDIKLIHKLNKESNAVSKSENAKMDRELKAKLDRINAYKALQIELQEDLKSNKNSSKLRKKSVGNGFMYE